MSSDTLLYIHGFASSPGSRKAQTFRSALASAGASLEIPDMDEGDFGHITISRQLNVLERTLNQQPARLVGSSMGGYLAALYAAAHPEVSRLVLLAPAFGFAPRWRRQIGIRLPSILRSFITAPKPSGESIMV